MIPVNDITIIIPITSAFSMKVKPPLFSISNNLDSLLAAFLGFILIQIFTKHSGIGISPDSVSYLSTSRHLLAGRGLLSFDNYPLVDFPVAYPFILTIISFFTQSDPLQYAPILNGLLFGLLIYLSGVILNGFDKPSPWYKRVILLCILMSPALQEVYSLLWSETVFLSLILLFILAISNYIQEASLKWLLISSTLCSVVCITRYAGIFLILTGLILIFFNREIKWQKRIIHCLFFGSLSFSLLAINIFRNHLMAGLFMGARPKSDIGIWKNMEYFGGVLCDWLLLDRKPVLAHVITMIVWLIFTTVIVVTRFYKKTKYTKEYVIAVTGLVYSLFMIFTSSLTLYEQFTNRLLSPVFIPIICCLSFWIPGLIAKSYYRFRWAWLLAVLIMASVFLKIQLAADYEYYDGVKDAGIPGYREDPFLQSDIVQFVEKYKSQFDPRFLIYSNAGEAVYSITGLAARQLPFAVFLPKVQEYYAMEKTYLVWFTDLDNPEMPDLNTILKNRNMVLIKQLKDGAVYVNR